jgi:hypothetical protein
MGVGDAIGEGDTRATGGKVWADGGAAVGLTAWGMALVLNEQARVAINPTTLTTKGTRR